MSFRSRVLVGATALLVVSTFLVGCGSDDATPASPAAAGDEQDITRTPARGPATAGAPLVLWLLEKTKTRGIECTKKSDAKRKLLITKGKNSEDNTGLVVNSDTYSYGTQQIGELFARDSLLIEWGEEGNYHLTIPNFAWLLFGYDGATTQPAADLTVKALGSVSIEQENLDEMVCSVVR